METFEFKHLQVGNEPLCIKSNEWVCSLILFIYL